MGRKGSGNKSKKSSALNNHNEINELIDKLLRISTLPQESDLSKCLENHREMCVIIEKIKKLQTNGVEEKSTTISRTSAAIIDRFTNWYEENGAELKGCDIREIENFGLGFITNIEIAASSLVISVPKKLMLTVEAAKKTPLKKLIEKDHLLGYMPNVALAIFLLYEKYKPESFWKPYIDILPTTYNTILYFTVDELLELKGSPTLETAIRQVKSIARQYAYFHKLFNTSDDAVSQLMRKRFNYEDYWILEDVAQDTRTIGAKNPPSTTSINTGAGQTTIAQRLGEKHTAKDLIQFLNIIHGNGIPHPDEFCSDESRAILNAAAQVYSKCETIDEYADSMKDLNKITTRIRIDNSHFANTYRKLLKVITSKGIYTFYMASINQLMLALSVEEAEKIVHAIFIVANSPKAGNLSNGLPTECSKQIKFLKNLITDEEEENEDEDGEDYTCEDISENKTHSKDLELFQPLHDDDTESEKINENSWGEWGSKLYEQCKQFFMEKGKEHNLYYVPTVHITKKLIRDLQLIPIWGNIYSKKYSGCRIPASSSSSESEFNRVKTYWLAKNLHSVRPDTFVEYNFKYLEGKLPIIASDLEEAHRSNENECICKICNEMIDLRSACACFNCQDLVHKQKCTAVVEQKILCLECEKSRLGKRNAAHASLENWGGMGQPKTKSKKMGDCIICKQGNLPGGAHTCSKCGTAVHIFSPCSYELDGEEEGYGQKRICQKCFHYCEPFNNTFENDKPGEEVEVNNSINNEKNFENVCESCANGDSPDGGCICEFSGKPVHIFEKCFINNGDGNEGFGEQRICIEYDKKSNDPGTDHYTTESQIKSTQRKQKVVKKKTDFLTKPKNKCRKVSKYHGNRPADVKDSLNWDKSESITVIKNGSDMNLEKQLIDGKMVVLTNTCATDSIIYIALFAIQDFPHLRELFEATKTDFMNLVLEILKNGVKTNTYKMRAQVLSKIIPMEESMLSDDLHVLSCNKEVAWLARQLLAPLNSAEEEIKCTKCKEKKNNILPTITIMDNYLKFASKETFLEEAWKPPVISRCCKCSSDTESSLLNLGEIIIFKVVNDMEINDKFKLGLIPKEIRNPINRNREIYLIGAVGFRGSTVNLRRSGGNTIRSDLDLLPTGHYVSYSYRRGNSSWMEADDLVGRTINRSDNYQITPRLIVYSKSNTT